MELNQRCLAAFALKSAATQAAAPNAQYRIHLVREELSRIQCSAVAISTIPLLTLSLIIDISRSLTNQIPTGLANVSNTALRSRSRRHYWTQHTLLIIFNKTTTTTVPSWFALFWQCFWS
ncbi:hypothetical protein Hamer_G002696 [Homarus americanus]|uniref:Uncharacterized protein n=1 Tax=Homarus americanus TaxID=6706 RepID=A0A8J5MTB7_HOMAM|nr:hypothetical protein Hamer_G002696 [Homarus americanus]